MLSDILFTVASLTVYNMPLCMGAPVKLGSERSPWTQFQHVHEAFLKPTSSYQMPAEYPQMQLNYDTIYMEVESDSTGKGLSPTRLPSTSDGGHMPRLITVLLMDWL